LVYQNPFIYWYNHKNEEDYTGPRYQAPDEALVVGGGLASIDVAKILQLENYERALRARGVQTDVYELEKKGVPAVCKMHGIAPEDLGVKGCLLIYRRRGQDMPLAQPPENARPDQIAKTEAIRQKMLRLAQEKYLFRVQDHRVATGLLVEDGRLVGLNVAETTVKGRRAEPVAGSEYQLRAPIVISSIGSVPEKIPGISMKSEYYDFNHEALLQYGESDHVFGVGNVVTGQGNIRSSLLHSREVTTKLIENYIGVADEGTAPARFYADAEARGTAQAQAVRDRVQVTRGLSYQEIAAIEVFFGIVRHDGCAPFHQTLRSNNVTHVTRQGPTSAAAVASTRGGPVQHRGRQREPVGRACFALTPPLRCALRSGLIRCRPSVFNQPRCQSLRVQPTQRRRDKSGRRRSHSMCASSRRGQMRGSCSRAT